MSLLFEWMMLNWRWTREGFVESWITNFQAFWGVESLIRSSRPQNHAVFDFSFIFSALIRLISVMDFLDVENKVKRIKNKTFLPVHSHKCTAQAVIKHIVISKPQQTRAWSFETCLEKEKKKLFSAEIAFEIMWWDVHKVSWNAGCVVVQAWTNEMFWTLTTSIATVQSLHVYWPLGHEKLDIDLTEMSLGLNSRQVSSTNCDLLLLHSR